MARTTLGSRMSDWENEQDQRYWQHLFTEAVEDEDYTQVDELIQEALTFDYEIPFTGDPKVAELLKKHGVK